MTTKVQPGPVTMEKLNSLAKRRGFIFPGSDIYGGLANSWDYGPLGTELKRNIMDAWWRRFVTSRGDMVGIDAATIMNPKVWEASGHLAEFTDPLAECKNCKNRFRFDALLVGVGPLPGGGRVVASTLGTEDTLRREVVAKAKKAGSTVLPEQVSVGPARVNESPEERILRPGSVGPLSAIPCPTCNEVGRLTEPRNFNLMFKTFIGPVEDDSSIAYLRGELAQAMFVNFRMVQDATRKRVPFGIAQQGKCFRNEITPGNYIFRTREFNLMEFEYFVHPSEWEKHFEYWLAEMKSWLDFLGVSREKLYFHEIPDGERAHYSKRTVDIEYQYPFGQKELYGIAYRTDFDLKRHMEKSKADLMYTDPTTNERYIPHVVEPTFGIDRSLLLVLLEAYQEEAAPTSEKGESETRVVLKIPKALAPFKVAVLPLSKKPELATIAEGLASDLRKQWATDYDETQSIGRRYRRQDEIGTPYCVTVDFQSLEDKAVTIRDRDSMVQVRVPVADLALALTERLAS